MGSWTCSADLQLQESSQDSPTLMTWHDPSSRLQVSQASQHPAQVQELYSAREIIYYTLKLLNAQRLPFCLYAKKHF